MTSKTTNKFSPEVRARAVRMVLDHEGEHPSRWAVQFAAPDKDPTSVIRTTTLDLIKHFLQSPPNVDIYGDLRGMCTAVSVSYRNRAVLELLQNAHDAHDPDDRNGRIHFVYDATEGQFGTLYAANDGGGFIRDNFKALCSPSRTTKSPFGKSAVGDSWSVCLMIQALDVDARAAGPNGRDRP